MAYLSGGQKEDTALVASIFFQCTFYISSFQTFQTRSVSSILWVCNFISLIVRTDYIKSLANDFHNVRTHTVYSTETHIRGSWILNFLFAIYKLSVEIKLVITYLHSKPISFLNEKIIFTSSLQGSTYWFVSNFMNKWSVIFYCHSFLSWFIRCIVLCFGMTNISTCIS